jgi:hypothetical protein
MTYRISEVVEIYADTAKDLLQQWRALGAQVTTNLDSPPYTADAAAADLGATASLALETGVKLAQMGFNALSTLVGEYTDEISVMDLRTEYPGATLGWKKHLTRGFGDTVPADNVKIMPSQLAGDQQDFRVRVDTTDCPGGCYIGWIQATAPDGRSEQLRLRIDVPRLG